VPSSANCLHSTRYVFQTGLTDIEKSEILSRFDAALQNLGREQERREEVEECIMSEGKIVEARHLNRNASLVSVGVPKTESIVPVA
jgi:hypothetical protein